MIESTAKRVLYKIKLITTNRIAILEIFVHGDNIIKLKNNYITVVNIVITKPQVLQINRSGSSTDSRIYTLEMLCNYCNFGVPET